jgi:excisionase family DNA binding protein
MSAANPNDRLMRFLQATPEMQAAIDRVLEGKIGPSPVTTGSPGAPLPDEAAASRDEFVTKKELAKRLSMTVRTVENWQRNGVLPFIKARKIVLFHWPDVVAHLQANHRVCRRAMPAIRRNVVCREVRS